MWIRVGKTGKGSSFSPGWTQSKNGGRINPSRSLNPPTEADPQREFYNLLMPKAGDWFIVPWRGVSVILDDGSRPVKEVHCCLPLGESAFVALLWIIIYPTGLGKIVGGGVEVGA